MSDSFHPATSGGPVSTRPVAEGLLAVVLLVVAAAFLWLPLDDMVVDGLFTWHLLQPQTVQGGLELVGLYVLLSGVLAVFSRPSVPYLVAVALPLSLYLRRHHVDLPTGVAVLYLETILAVGGSAQRLVRRSPPGLRGDLERFLLGTTLWAALALVLSAFGLGDTGELRWAAVAVAAVAFPLARRAPVSYRLALRLPALPLAHKLLAAFFLTHLAALLARTNVTVYHDSLWYTLRGEYVLAPEGGSLFEGFGLVSQVHYYPKLLELLTLAVSGLGDFSFVLAFNVAAFVVLLVALFVLGRRLGLERGHALLAAGVVGTVPAVANIPLTGKPDLFAALLLCLAALYLWDFLEALDWRSGLLGLSAVQLSFATKITSLAYGGLLLVAALVLGGGRWLRLQQSEGRGPCAATTEESGPHRGPATATAALAFAGSVGVLAALTLRTYLLTGLPTLVPDQLASLWQRLGFSLRPPVGVIPRNRGENLADIPALAVDFLFHPSRLPLGRITWVGNQWLFFALAALLLVLVHRRRGPSLLPAWAWAPVILAGGFFALAFNNAERGGDGNYYMFPLILASVLALSVALRSARRELPVLVVCGLAFIAVQSGLGFITAAWAPGTRAWDLDFARSPFDTADLRRQKLAAHGMLEIGEALAAMPGTPRVVGLGPEDVTRWLPARYESLRVISYSRPSPIESPLRLLEYLRAHRIEFVLVPKVRRWDLLGEVLENLYGRPDVRTIDDRLYRLLDLRDADLHPEALAAQVEPARRKVLYSLARRFSEARAIGQHPLQAPWGQAISRADGPTELYVGSPSLILIDGTELRYTLELPARIAPLVSAQVGLYPHFQILGQSDGAVARVTARRIDGTGPELAGEVEVFPHTGFLPLEVDLGPLAGSEVELTLAVVNRKGFGAEQDWVVWAYPVVESVAEPGPEGGRTPGSVQETARQGD